MSLEVICFKIIRPEEKTLLRRIAEIYTTLQTKKWNGTASIELLEDSGWLTSLNSALGFIVDGQGFRFV